MERIGIDAGNYEVKVVGGRGPMRFLSLIGEHRDRKIHSVHGDCDMEWEYEGHLLKRGFAGTLAQFESELAVPMFGESKFHEDAKLRTLLAIHRYADSGQVQVVVGQPISTHGRDKLGMKADLLGKHSLKLNGVTKTFQIVEAEVAIEGGASFWNKEQMGTVRIIDVGSGTVNYVTLRDKRYQDRESGTLPFGVESLKSAGLPAVARRIGQELAHRWGKEDPVRLVGGSAEAIEPLLQAYFPQAAAYFPTIHMNGTIQRVNPVYANAAGFYDMGRLLFK